MDSDDLKRLIITALLVFGALVVGFYLIARPFLYKAMEDEFKAAERVQAEQATIAKPPAQTANPQNGNERTNGATK